MHYALDVRSGSVDGRVEGESCLVYAQISAAAVYDLTLQVDLHLKTHSMLKYYIIITSVSIYSHVLRANQMAEENTKAGLPDWRQ